MGTTVYEVRIYVAGRIVDQKITCDDGAPPFIVVGGRRCPFMHPVKLFEDVILLYEEDGEYTEVEDDR